MKILYDYQALTLQKYGGISRYFYEIMKRMKRENVGIELPVVYFDNYYFQEEVKSISHEPFKKDWVNGVNMNLHIKLHKKEIDILHPTYYKAWYLSNKELRRKKYKLIITVHDMIHELFIQDDRRTIESKKRMIEAADGIITVSEWTKRDLLQFYPELDEKKIEVIYHGCSMVVPNEPKVRIQFPKKYILFVGLRAGYKNVEVLFRAMKIVCASNKDLMLLCVGGGALTEDEIKLLKELGIREQVKQYNMTDDELYIAYKNAECFVFPSKYEGFGIPILEAFTSKCPVILSESSCFPEIAEDAALYFKEDAVDDLASKIFQVIEDAEFKRHLVEKGTERLKKFSWEKATKETLAFYQRIIQQ